jgi:tetratricopeptide (TPR) repeat protein
LYTVHDFAKAADALEVWLRNYPRDAAPHLELGNIHVFLGQLEEKLKENEEAYRLDPQAIMNVHNLMEAFLDLSRFDDAKVLAGKTFARHIDPAVIHQMLLNIAGAQDDPAAEAIEIRWLVGKPEEAFSVGYQASSAASHGQLQRSRELLKRLAELARQQNELGFLAFLQPMSSALSALGANCTAVQSLGAAAVLLCSDVEGPLKAAEEEAKKYPADATVSETQLPTLRAQAELKRDNAAKAVEFLQSVAPYERAAPPSAAFYRGLAYLQLHKPTEAGIEFQKFLDNPGLSWGGPEYPMAFLGRARAAALSGDTSKAAKVYLDSLRIGRTRIPICPFLLKGARNSQRCNPRSSRSPQISRSSFVVGVKISQPFDVTITVSSMRMPPQPSM